MENIKLWENDTPYFNPEYGQEEPSVTPYIVDSDKPTGCIIVIPGGGYAMRAEDHEGVQIAQMLNKAGISAFVLHYRIAPYKHPVMQTDVNRAVRFVRYHAAKYNIDPNKIGVLGFSAGGHLASTAITHYDSGLDCGDEIDRVSCRPDAGVLCYAVISLGIFTHGGTKFNLLGENPPDELVELMSGELNVKDDCPPVFLWHTADDGSVPVENSLQMGMALRAKNIPFELHVFPHGPHGLGLAPGDEIVSQWAPLLCKWLKKMEF